MHPLPSWVATRGWSGPQKTHGVFPSVDLSLANEAAWRRFVQVLEQQLLPLRSPSPPDRQGQTTPPLVVRLCVCLHTNLLLCLHTGMMPLKLPTAKPLQCGSIAIAFTALGLVLHCGTCRCTVVPTRLSAQIIGIGRYVSSLSKNGGRDWAAKEHPLGEFSYVTYSQSDFDRFGKEWNNHGGDFSKPGMVTCNLTHRHRLIDITRRSLRSS